MLLRTWLICRRQALLATSNCCSLAQSSSKTPSSDEGSNSATPNSPKNQSNSESSNLHETPVCCGTGCPNCVWIEYADRLVQQQLGAHGVQKAIERAEHDIQDPSIRAFVLMELRSKLKEAEKPR